MRARWNDQEDEALQGLPWMAQLLYLRGLRPYMDYASGVVGIKRGISYQGLGETLYLEPGQGRHESGSPSSKALRHAVSLLERAGLIVKVPADRRLVFELPKADRDDSDQKKWGRRRADVGQTKQGIANDSEIIDLENEWGGFGADPEGEKWGTPPLSDIRSNNTSETPRESAPKSVRGARLSLVVLPDDWRDWSRQQRPDLDPEAAWQNFRDYWIAIPGAKGCKADWQATWRNWVRREQTKSGGHHGNRCESVHDRRARINQSLIADGQRAFDEMGGGLARPVCGDLA